MDKIDWQAVISAFVALATGIGLYLQNKSTANKVDATAQKVDENTDLTQRAKDAAERVQQATVDRLDYDRLRRLEAALITLPECEPCRTQILAITDRRRVWRPVTEPHENAQSPEGL